VTALVKQLKSRLSATVNNSPQQLLNPTIVFSLADWPAIRDLRGQASGFCA